jgi:hypothetical protein
MIPGRIVDANADEPAEQVIFQPLYQNRSERIE